jgi:hypothetical protein
MISPAAHSKEADMDDWGDTLIAVVAVVGAFSYFGVIMFMGIRAQIRARELLHAERQAALEKGLPLPEEPPAPTTPAGSSAKKPPAHALKMGIFWLFLGLGIILSLRIADPGSGRWAWGIIVVAVGLADLVYWFVRGKAEDDAAKREVGGK